MLAFSTTSYYPFDSEAPAIFRSWQTDNYLSGEWLKQSHDPDFVSCLLTHQLHSLYGNSIYDLLLTPDIYSPGRRYCFMITLSLWTRRYEVYSLVLSSTASEMIRSSGYGRSSTAFNESGLALINSQRLRWRLPKIVFFLNRYVTCLLILCVTCNTYAQKANKLER
jgi:hypothetical protein